MTYTEFQTLRKEAADAAQINAENAALTDKRLANTGYGKAYMDVPAPQELLYHGLGAVGGVRWVTCFHGRCTGSPAGCFVRCTRSAAPA